MTPRLARRDHGKGHSYTIDGHRVPGVTTICGILDKPALVAWAAKETAAYADDHWHELSSLRSADRIERLEKARFQSNRSAIVKGNRIHALGERVAKGERLDESEVSPEIRGYVESYARFLDDWDMEIIHTELPVANTDYLYAGTLDCIAYSPRLGTILLDIKTGKGVYDEVALQLAAYRFANIGVVTDQLVGPRGGIKRTSREIPLPSIDQCMVAHVRETAVEFHPVRADRQVFEMFIYMLEIWNSWINPLDWKNRDEEFALRVIDDPIYPEDRPNIGGEEK